MQLLRNLSTALLVLATPIAQAADYEIDADHTFVYFEVLHNSASTVRGRFDDISGSVQFDAQAKTGQVKINIDMASISTGSKGFDEHLRGEDFFGVAQHPQASFESGKFLFEGDKVYALEGELSLLGQTHPVKLNAVRFSCYQNKRSNKEVCGGDFKAELMREQWGMKFGLPGIPNQVKLLIEIEAARKD